MWESVSCTRGESVFEIGNVIQDSKPEYDALHIGYAGGGHLLGRHRRQLPLLQWRRLEMDISWVYICDDHLSHLQLCPSVRNKDVNLL